MPTITVVPSLLLDVDVDMYVGGRRTVTVPAAQGFGEKGGQVAASLHAPDKQGVIPKDATLTYDLELIRVSIPPS